MSTSAPDLQMADVKVLFDQYLELTHLNPTTRFKRTTGEHPNFTYPEATIQTDMLAFAGVFTCVWQAIGAKKCFTNFYSTRQHAFHCLAQLQVNEEPHSMHNCFWSQGGKKGSALQPLDLKDENAMREMCRTLRNGFQHFNFRYVNLAPVEYFKRLHATVPMCFDKPHVPHNYRIFVCDHGHKKKLFEPNSDTRVLDVGFGHLRYSLFLFLAFFFWEKGRPYQDLLFDDGTLVSGQD